ncbi:hypothetical protein HYPSUDRAFT_201842 [Hypholoma sublateritium FD-334 SS-4]|uniref:RBR-type E3 ubiquitin transferase n=1 Tax=Hypholoma sublateritium (strain FD-334 SS-4) TaxID=945553 RepID=A0A0D2P230_HYPSF|nr:hypothetical protein HYPSUDRAFT_201842 [Hypholoma sublateritium FD-334 SS-4]
MSTTGKPGGPAPSVPAGGKSHVAASSQKPCKKWQSQGKCQFAGTCRYRHAEEERGVLAHTNVVNAVSKESPQRPHSSTAKESASVNGTDSAGGAAPRKRDRKNKQKSTSASPASVPSGANTNAPVVYGISNFPVKKVVCVNWKARKCIYGDKCRWSHPVEVAQLGQASGPPTSTNQKQGQAQSEDFRRRLYEKQIELDKAQAKLLEEERLAKERAHQEAEQKRLEEEAREREREIQERLAREDRERKANEARRRKEEAAQRRKDERLRRQELARQKREAEQEARRRDEERIAREQAEREAARKERQEQLKAVREKEAAVIEQYVVSDSSLITCGGGMDIRHVVTGFELCRITIKNLPYDARHDEVVDIFTHQGIDASEFFIQEVKPIGNKVEAIVLANAEQGEAIALGLEGIEFRNEMLTFQVSANASWTGMGDSGRSTPFLTVSWWVPSETIIVTYDSMEKAREQVAKLNSKVWNNRRIRVTMNERPNGAAARYFVNQSKFLGASPEARVLNSTEYELAGMFKLVHDHIATFAGAQMDTYDVMSNGNRIDGEARVKVQFADWEDAKRAYDTMDKKRLSSLKAYPVLRCWLPKPLQYSIRIPRQQYEAQKKQWDELSEKRPDRDAHVHTKVGDRGDVFIRVLGQDKKAAGSLKVRVEGMVAGEKLDSTTHWHPSFDTPRAKALFDRVLATNKVYVRSDFKTRSLRVYGEGEKIELAKEMIKAEVRRLANMESTRVLDQGCVRGFMREGLGKLKELLGDENVTVNMSMNPYRVTIKGGAEATHHLQRLMDESRTKDALDDIFPGDSDKETCPICYDDVSNPEELGCGHTYCSGCLRHYLTSAVDTKMFPLLCMGNEAQCKVPIAIPAIRRFLHPHAFQNLIEATFVSYLEQHPQELKYCTTPDCKQIYRRNLNKTLLQCPSCYSTICPSCDGEAHEGMTCEERRIQQDPAEQERLNDELAREHGFKKCPSCSVLIEKTEGCNHMTCRCGAHICWICLSIHTPATIYYHLNNAHGGIYNELPAGVNREDQDENAFLAVQIQEIQRMERAREALRQRLAHPDILPAPLQAVHNAYDDAAGRQPVQAHVLAWEGARNAAAAQAREERIREHRAEVAAQEVARLRVRQDAAAAERRREVTRERERQAEAAERRRREDQGGWCVMM